MTTPTPRPAGPAVWAGDVQTALGTRVGRYGRRRWLGARTTVAALALAARLVWNPAPPRAHGLEGDG
jgi:hypothetical protein